MNLNESKNMAMTPKGLRLLLAGLIVMAAGYILMCSLYLFCAGPECRERDLKGICHF